MRRSFRLGLCVCLFSAALTSCSMFGSKSNAGASAQALEFDPRTTTWQPSRGAVVPPPSQPATPMAREEQPKEPGILKKTGGALKKPFKWIPGVD